LAAVTGLDIGIEIKVAGREAGFNVVAEGGGEALVDWFGDGNEVQPAASSEVGGCGRVLSTGCSITE